MWASGENLADNKDWKHWKDGEPNNAKNHQDIEEDCAAVGYGGTLVADINCNSERPVLCVKGKLCDNTIFCDHNCHQRR